MLEYLYTLPFWQIILLALIILIPILVFLVWFIKLLVGLLSKKEIKTSFFEMKNSDKSDNDGNKNEKTDSISSAGFILNPEFLKEYTESLVNSVEQTAGIVMNKSIEVMWKKSECLFIGTTRQQMSYAEQKIWQIKDFLEENFLEILNNKQLSTNIQLKNNYQYYTSLLEQSISTIKDILRTSFKENHFDEKSPSELEKYIYDKTDLIYKKHINFVKILFLQDEVLTFEDIYTTDFKADLFDLTHKTVKDIFIEGIKIKQDHNKKLDSLDEELKEAVSEQTRFFVNNLSQQLRMAI